MPLKDRCSKCLALQVQVTQSFIDGKVCQLRELELLLFKAMSFKLQNILLERCLAEEVVNV
jgi:hypothetical protein